MALAVLNPIPTFSDLDGTPLSDGFLYFGAANQNPVTVPTTVYWDAAGTQPVAQPVRTINGFPSRTGSPAIVYASVDFSLLVLNKRGQSVLYAANSADFGNGASIAAAASAQVAAVRADLADSSNTAEGDALVAGKRSEAGATAHTLHAATQERAYSLVLDAGAVGDGSADDSNKLAIAAASGAKVIDGGGRTYRVVTKFTVSGSDQVWQNCVFKFDGANTTRILDVTGNRITFSNVVFDGNAKQPRGSMVYVDTNVVRPRFLFCKFHNLLGTAYGSNTLNQMCALNITPYGVTDFLIYSCEFSNIRKYNDGSLITPAAGLGFAGGVYFLVEGMTEPSGTQTVITRGIIALCTFSTIQTILAGSLTDNQVNTFDDGDAIRSLGGSTGDAPSLNVHVADCTFIACSKRAIKFRASGGVVTDCEVYTTGNAYGMSTPIDMVYDCTADNVRVYASAALPCIAAANIGHGGVSSNSLTQLSNFYCSHNKAGVQLLSVAGAPFQNVTLDGIVLPNASINGIQQSNATPCTTQKNLIVKNVKVVGSGNNCQGLALSQAADSTGGWRVENVELENADWKVEGINNDLEKITTNVTSTSFAGSAAGRAVAEYGLGKGFGGYNRASKIVLNLAGLNTAYLSATRPYLTLFYSDILAVRGVQIVVPEGLTTAYPHWESYGDDATIDGFEYQGAGTCRHGHLVASLRWGVKNAVRRGNGACSTPFWDLNKAGTQYYEFEGITDYRPTTATTITSATATNGIASNVKTRSSNATPAVSGVAKTANLNTF